MARTYRNQSFNGVGLRSPQTFSEIKSLNALAHEAEAADYPLSSHHRRPPTSWDDLTASSMKDRQSVLGRDASSRSN